MSESKYYEISCDDDGDVHVQAYTKEELERELERAAKAEKDGEPARKFSSTVPGADPAYWDGKRILIKGEIVVPRPREVVEVWELP